MHIKFVTLPASDQDRAKAFYIGNLGCEVVADKPYRDDGWRWIELKLPGAETTLLLERRQADAPDDSPRLVFVDPGLDVTVAALRAARVEILTEPKEAPWGPGRRFAEFRDSEGNRMVLTSS